jgi:16S rRNA (adenine(1408)-N(1))-methyltransferase
MEIIRGKHVSFIDTLALAGHLAAYDLTHIDIGTGDGRFVQHLAQANPTSFVIGIDACRENLHEVSRRAPANTLFVIANAQRLPLELHGLADHVTINFPWGSLLYGLLTHDSAMLANLKAVSHPATGLDVRLNGGALAEAGWSLEAGADRVHSVLAASGFDMWRQVVMTVRELKALPTTWAKRLAFGRDPRAMYLKGRKKS